MPISQCAKQPFEGTQQALIPHSVGIIDLVRDAHIPPAVWKIQICRRPIIPLYGVKQKPDGTYEYLPSSVANAATILEIARSCLDASKNLVQDNLAGANQYADGEYGDYLFRRMGNHQCIINRYLDVYNKVQQWLTVDAANLGAWNNVSFRSLEFLMSYLRHFADKEMYIPPTEYTFKNGSSANTALEAWFVADPTLSALFGLELVTT